MENSPPTERERRVYESGEDDEVRWEVLKMLQVGESGLLDLNLRARPTSVYSAGESLADGRFRIEALIAEGGMGEVYRAVDTELQSDIALKTIHRTFAHDDIAVERFKQEVHLARSINHPNVCRIFDLGKQTGRNGRDQFFLTMELLDGETLRSRLNREKVLSQEQALRVMEPVLQALAASHERGILHRDLKPSNIQLAESGKRVVVTDFGLARSAKTEQGPDASSAGTPAYMAPEQFGRDHASPATDIYAAGVLLYEMVCGRLPFTGKTVDEVLEQKQLNQAVPVRHMAPVISKRWEAAIYKAMQADPAKRFASAGEFLAAIRPRRRTVYRYAFTAAGLLVFAWGLYFVWEQSNALSKAPLASQKLTSDSGYSMEPTLSSDGQFVVYTSDRGLNGVRSLWRMRVGENTPVQITFDEVDSHQPHLSPDSQQVVFRSEKDGGGLYIAPVEDGRRARKIVSGGVRPRFSPDGRWILYMGAPATASQLPQVYAVRADGGSPVHVSAGFSDAHNPIWSEDGKFVLFCGTRTPGVATEEHDWWILPFQTAGVARKTGVLPALSKLAADNTANRINEDLWEWRDGYVYYSSPLADSSSIWRLKLLPQSRGGQIEPPERLTYGTGLDTQPAVGGGKVVFASSITNIDIWTLPLNTNTGSPLSPPLRVTDNTDYEVSSSADPSGRFLVFTKALGAKRELRLIDLHTDRDSRPWSLPEEVADHPVWAPDGEWVAYRVYDRPKLRVFMKSRKTAESRLICADCGSPTDWSPNQRYLLYEPGSTIAFVGRLNVESGEQTEWIKHPFESLRHARYSPDGNWIAFQAETSRSDRRLYITRNLPQDSDRLWIPISQPDGENMVDILPSWSPDGNLLYFLSNRDGFRCIFAQRLDPATKRPVGPAFDVQHFHRSRRSLLRILTARAPQIGFRVYRDRAFFSMDEVTGNLWIADLRR